MCRKGRERLLYALLVADVGKYVVKDRDKAAVGHRNHQSAHGHEGQQSDRLYCDRLAAGVGTGYDKGIVIAAQRYGYRHRLFAVEQRMTRVFEVYQAVRIYLRSACLHIERQ